MDEGWRGDAYDHGFDALRDILLERAAAGTDADAPNRFVQWTVLCLCLFSCLAYAFVRLRTTPRVPAHDPFPGGTRFQSNRIRNYQHRPLPSIRDSPGVLVNDPPPLAPMAPVRRPTSSEDSGSDWSFDGSVDHDDIGRSVIPPHPPPALRDDAPRRVRAPSRALPVRHASGWR